MAERPAGPMIGWRPRTAWESALVADLLDRIAQHRDEDTLPRSPRGLFYDLRPNGMGHGLTYVKQPPMWCILGEHPMGDVEGKCREHRSDAGNAGPVRREDPMVVGPDQVQETLSKMRRAGLVSENDIEDRRAPSPDVPYYNTADADELAEQWIEQIRDPAIEYSPQRGQPVYLEVLVEAGGLIGRMARIAGEYGVPVYSGGGYGGLKSMMARGTRAFRRDVPTIVLQVADCDEHGRRIAHRSEVDSVAWARAYGAEPGWLSFETIALTEEQAESEGLLDEDGKAEADALSVPAMDAILREAIERYQDPDIRAENAELGVTESGRVTTLVLAALNGGGGE